VPDGLIVDYADTSALLKLVLPEPESPRIGNYLTSKDRIFVSSLVILEMRTQVRGFFLSGKITRQQYRRIEKYIPVLVRSEPLEYQELSGAVFRMANEQIEAAPEVHCRTLDRLHLAAMRELGATTLVTFDKQRARAARALGLSVADL
jgi:predicted nucleic acid-binding protein